MRCKLKFLKIKTNDPEYNLSLEEYCFKYLPDDDEYFFFWINEPAIIIGKNQNVFAEINRDYVEENNIKVVRRITGGGAVYHDLNNINFSYVSKKKSNQGIDFTPYYKMLVAAMKNMGIDAELTGRNDLTIDGYKIAGASQSVWHDRMLSNCCILYDVNLENLAKSLTVRKEKLESKGVKSVRARVSNIKPLITQDLTAEEFLENLQSELIKNLGDEVSEYVLTDEDLKGIDKIYTERFSKREWNYGRVLHTDKKIYKRFNIGFVELFFNVRDDKIEQLKIMGDFFGEKDVEKLCGILENCPYSREAFDERLKDVDLKKYFGDIPGNEFINLFFE